MHYFLIAGEASGDLHAAALMEALAAVDPEAAFNFIGGDRMAAVARKKPIIHISRMAFMGFSEVLRNLGTVRANLRTARDAVRLMHPDALILIDYPSFNLKVAEYASSLGVPVYYYISPKLWAWKKWRINAIKKYVRRVFAILPFEPEFYIANGAEAVYVGNPSVGEIGRLRGQAAPRAEFLARHCLRDRPLIALMPGSRLNEIRRNLPVMLGAVAEFPQYRPVIVAAPSVPPGVYAAAGARGVPLIKEDHAALILAHCRAALVTSGTATLETALMDVPQVALYRANGSRLSYELMSRILDVKFVTLPNLITNSPVVPEMLLHECTARAVAERLRPLLREGTPEREAQREGYRRMREILGDNDAAATTAELIYADLTVGEEIYRHFRNQK